MTFAVDWTLKTNYVSIYTAVPRVTYLSDLAKLDVYTVVSRLACLWDFANLYVYIVV